MNEGKAAKIRKRVKFNPHTPRTYTRDPRTGVIYSNMERQGYQKAKKI